MGPGGAPYVTAAQLGQYLPAAVLNLATSAQQDQACLDATEEADAYIRGRYSLPLLAWGADIVRHTAAVAIYNLMDGPIGWAAAAGSDRNIRAAYARALGGPHPDNPSYIEPGFFPGIQRQNIQPDVTPSIPVGSDPLHDSPCVTSNQPRGWQQFTANGRPAVGGF
jgi:hypothetical protein